MSGEGQSQDQPRRARANYDYWGVRHVARPDNDLTIGFYIKEVRFELYWPRQSQGSSCKFFPQQATHPLVVEVGGNAPRSDFAGVTSTEYPPIHPGEL